MTSPPTPPPHDLGRVAERSSRCCTLRGAQYAEHHERSEHVDDRGHDGADDGGTRNGSFRIAYVFRGNGCRLEADERPECERRRCGDGAVDRILRRVERTEVRPLHVEQSHHGHDGEGDELCHRGDELRDPALTDADHIDGGAQPNRTNGDDCREHIVGPQAVPVLAEVAHERDRDRGITDPRRDPIPPRLLEADEVTECAAAVHVRPAGLRVRPSESCEDERQENRTNGGDAERDEAHRSVGAEAGRQQEHPRSDHVADDERRRHRESEPGGAPDGGRCHGHGRPHKGTTILRFRA